MMYLNCMNKRICMSLPHRTYYLHLVACLYNDHEYQLHRTIMTDLKMECPAPVVGTTCELNGIDSINRNGILIRN